MRKKDKTYSKKDVCAVIVTYNPDSLLKENIEALSSQVNEILLVDNGSKTNGFYCLSDIYSNIKVIKLGENKGVAAALNVGLKYCKTHRYQFILTMDQDTILSLDAVGKLLKSKKKYKCASVGINWDGKIKIDSQVDYLITSGNLLSVKVAYDIGLFDERLFVDSVDFEFCLRLRDAGYHIFKVADALAKHNLGEKQGKSSYVTHSIERYYYIYRNHFYLMRKYWENHKIFFVKKNLVLGFDLIRILVFDKERIQKFKMLKKGYIDSKSF